MPHDQDDSHSRIIELLRKNSAVLKETVRTTLQKIEESALTSEEYTKAVIETFSLDNDESMEAASILASMKATPAEKTYDLRWREKLHDSMPNQYQAFSNNKTCVATINRRLKQLLKQASAIQPELVTLLEEISVKSIRNASTEKFWFSVTPGQPCVRDIIEILAQDDFSMDERIKSVGKVYSSIVRPPEPSPKQNPLFKLSLLATRPCLPDKKQNDFCSAKHTLTY